MPAVVIRQRKGVRRKNGVCIFFEDNAGVIVNNKGEMKGRFCVDVCCPLSLCVCVCIESFLPVQYPVAVIGFIRPAICWVTATVCQANGRVGMAGSCATEMLSFLAVSVWPVTV